MAETTSASESPAMDATTAPSSTAERGEVANKLVDRFALWSGVAGLIPIPVVDVLAVGGLQIQMLRRLSQIYDVQFSENRGKALIAALAGTMIPATSGMGAASAMKADPGRQYPGGGLRHAGAFRRRYLRHRQGVHPAF